MRGTLTVVGIMAGAILYAADNRYVQVEDFVDLNDNISEMREQMDSLSITLYESQLIQTELAISELSKRETLTYQDERRLEELRVKRSTLKDRLQWLRGGAR